MDMKKVLTASVVVAALALPAAALAADNGQASPRKVDGLWISMTTLDPSDVLPVAGSIPELDSFASDGVNITTSASTIIPLTAEGLPDYVQISAGHGAWKWNGKDGIVLTQYRFVTDPATLDFVGWARIAATLHFTSRDTLYGPIRVELLDSEGNPTGVTITGTTSSRRVAP